MRKHIGETRTQIRDRHALISPDSHERTTLPNWPGSDVIVVISPQLGARFTEYFVDIKAGCSGHIPLPGVQRFVLVLGGAIKPCSADDTHVLGVEGYALIPANCEHTIEGLENSHIVVLEKPYVPLPGMATPKMVVGHTDSVQKTPMKGDDALLLQKLLPSDIAFDCEVNIMDFAPGASLPYVETHFMEHGLLFMDGGGIYRLDNSWYPVEKGDIIWMGPFSAQWFGAIGKRNARYLIYKNWNRDPHIS